MPLGTGAYGAGPSGDRNAHSFAPIDVTHFWWGAGNSSGLALINVEVPEPTSLALLGVGVLSGPPLPRQYQQAAVTLAILTGVLLVLLIGTVTCLIGTRVQGAASAPQADV